MKKSNLFIRRSIEGALSFFKEAVFSEEVARSKGLLQSLDPRFKAVSLLIVLIMISLVRDIYSLAAFYGLSILLAALSGIDILFFIKRVWFFIPVFALLIAIPAVFLQGLSAASIFVMRVAASVSWVVLITITTRHDRMLKSLRAFGIPAIFVQTLDMTYRYIFFLLKIFEEMHMALKTRLISSFKPKEARHWIASRIGHIFRRSIKMSEEVYMAMVARGYTGK